MPAYSTEPETTPPGCRPTVGRIQAVLDGGVPASALVADPHVVGCATCRGRVRAAQLLLTAFPPRPVPVAVPSGLADRVLVGVRADRRRRSVARIVGIAAGLAVAVALVVWSPWRATDGPEVVVVPPKTEPAGPPIQVGKELARAGMALKEGSQAFVEPVTAAPKLFAALTETVTAPVVPPSPSVEPARQSLADLPDAARAGLEPVTGSARKAWNRLLRDVGAVAAKPTS